jgi:hypothetical protein
MNDLITDVKSLELETIKNLKKFEIIEYTSSLSV